jgi:hypothetical protein
MLIGLTGQEALVYCNVTGVAALAAYIYIFTLIV